VVGKLLAEDKKTLGHGWKYEYNTETDLNRHNVRMWAGFVWFSAGNSCGSSKHRNKLPDDIKEGLSFK
jgi:hypothetical protein